MIRIFLVLLLTLFQDNYVRLGTLIGVLAYFFISDILDNEEIVLNTFIYGFIGWGCGAYISSNRKVKKTNEKKFKIFQGGKK